MNQTKVMTELTERIMEVAHEMARCTAACDGVSNSPLSGCPPRGLLLETIGRTGASGSIVSGQNPGLVGDVEKRHYLTEGAGYKQQLAAWENIVRDVRYFTRLRQLLGCLGLDGPILWTDVAKCEGKNPPQETLMTCSQRFLSRELAVTPSGWPVIAAGSRAFQALGYMAGVRPVVGFPHPTGSHAAHRFLAILRRLSHETEYRAEVQQRLRTPASRVWLGS